MTKKQRLILTMVRKKIIEFGSFKLKSGSVSPYYIDIRKLVSYPKLQKQVCAVYWSLLKDLKFDRLAGVPYAALPTASAISVLYNLPMIYTRKETQDYGISKLVQGEYNPKEVVVVIDDIITTGDSKLMVIKPLEKAGLKVKDVVLLIDRQNGGREIIEKKGYNLHTVFLMNEILDFLLKRQKISKKLYQQCLDFMQAARKKNLKGQQ